MLAVCLMVECGRLPKTQRSHPYCSHQSMACSRSFLALNDLFWCIAALAAGGGTGSENLASAELYNTVTGTWAPTGIMTEPRRAFQMVQLKNGTG